MKKTEVTIKRKLVINNATEALILFKENYQGLLTLYVLLAGEVPMWEKLWDWIQQKEFILKLINDLLEGFSKHIKILFNFWRVFWEI